MPSQRIKLQIIASTKQIAQCQINVDTPLLFGKAFFRRIREEFVDKKKNTADFTWRKFLMKNGKFKYNTDKRFIIKIMKYFLPVDAYIKLIKSISCPEYENDPIYGQLYDILRAIRHDNLQYFIKAYKQNHAFIQAYISMIKQYVKKAIEAGAVIIFFPEFTFTNLDLENDKEFMELTSNRIIVAGGIENVPEHEIDAALNNNLSYIKKQRAAMLSTKNLTIKETDKIELDIDEKIIVNGLIYNFKEVSKKKIKDAIRYTHWEENLDKYIKFARAGEKSLYYNVTQIYIDKHVRRINKNIITPREANYGIVPGREYAVVKTGLFNMMMINCAEFFGDDWVTFPGLRDEILDIIKYTEMENDDNNYLAKIPQLRQMREQHTPITATAVISYQELAPFKLFNYSFLKLFEVPDVKLGLFTNTGSIHTFKYEETQYCGQTGFYYQTIYRKDIDRFIDDEKYHEIIEVEEISGIKDKQIYCLQFKKDIRFGMMVSSYLDDPEHPYLTDLQVYLPKDSEYGELESQF